MWYDAAASQILGIDFTKSNEWTGKRSFGSRCLHDVSFSTNPYREAVRVIGRSLEVFDDDKLIPTYGFGTAEAGADKLVSFMPGDQPCHTFQQVEQRYLQLAPQMHMAGPTTFAPIIRKAIEITAASGGQYHILVIVADGQVTRPSSTAPGQLSQFEQDTANAIVEASNYPLSIVMVGVGDGPWDTMQQFDDAIPNRKWDNWQTVLMEQSLGKKGGSLEYCPPEAEAQFALDALMEVPDQYNITQQLNLLYSRKGVNHAKVQIINPPEVAMSGPPQGGFGGPSPAAHGGQAPYPGQGPPSSGGQAPYPGQGPPSSGGQAPYPGQGPPSSGGQAPYPGQGPPSSGGQAPYPGQGPPSSSNHGPPPAQGNGVPYPPSGSGAAPPYAGNTTTAV